MRRTQFLRRSLGLVLAALGLPPAAAVRPPALPYVLGVDSWGAAQTGDVVIDSDGIPDEVWAELTFDPEDEAVSGRFFASFYRAP